MLMDIGVQLSIKTLVVERHVTKSPPTLENKERKGKHSLTPEVGFHPKILISER